MASISRRGGSIVTPGARRPTTVRKCSSCSAICSGVNPAGVHSSSCESVGSKLARHHADDRVRHAAERDRRPRTSELARERAAPQAVARARRRVSPGLVLVGGECAAELRLHAVRRGTCWRSWRRRVMRSGVSPFVIVTPRNWNARQLRERRRALAPLAIVADGDAAVAERPVGHREHETVRRRDTGTAAAPPPRPR